MTTDIFTGGPSGSPIGWSDDTAWSAGAPPTPSDTVEQTGFATVDIVNSDTTTGPLFPVEAVGGLVLENGADLAIPSGGALLDWGDSNPAFGGAGSTVNVDGKLLVETDVASGTGTINVGAGGTVTYQGSDFTGNVNVASNGVFVVQGESFSGTANVSGAFELDQQGSPASGSHAPTINMQGGQLSIVSSDQSGAVNMAGGGTIYTYTQYNGTIEHFNADGEVVVWYGPGADSATATTDTISSNSVTLNFSSGISYTINFDSTAGINVAADGTRFNITSTTPVCFGSGTLIRTPRGEVAVEDLKVGDLTVTAAGEARPIKWLGHRRIEHPAREHWPVRVMVGAFGEGLPARHLLLSPGHAVCVDVMGEVFVPVSLLINGATIAQVERDEVTYWHVELENHDALLAEGLPCESYMDAGNRAFFGREYGRLETIDPGLVAESLTRYARPFVDHGPIVAAIRERLAARAEAIFAERESAEIGPDRAAA
jgi:hypothetical protein